MGQRLFQSAATGRLPTYRGAAAGGRAGAAEARDARLAQARASRSIVTHDLADDANDPVLKHLRHRGLFNAADDPVKIVFHPEFVTATSPPISLDYEQFVRGCHLGIFPSYYEPWGYTPMECIALGVPAVTTDLSGFGAYVESHLAEQQASGRRRSDDGGMLVLNRRGARLRRHGRCAGPLPVAVRAAQPPAADRAAQPRRAAGRELRLVRAGAALR